LQGSKSPRIQTITTKTKKTKRNTTTGEERLKDKEMGEMEFEMLEIG